MRLAAFLALLLPSCSTTIYNDAGKPLARIQSDVTDLAYRRSADGSVTLTASSMSNSAPVLAAGQIVKTAAAAWSAAQALKEAPNTINAITGNHPVP